MRSHLAVLILISCIFTQLAYSQTTSNELAVHGQTGKLYLEHPVVAKENWYSVGRLYNISPKELASFNHLALTQPLSIGQVLQIPLTAVNFSQNMQKTPAETLVPLYHVTQEKEWMYRISVNHNKVPVPTLEKWNNMNKDAVRPGMHLIVGYLKVKTALSALANEAHLPPSTVAKQPATASTETTAATTTTPATNNPATTSANPPATNTTNSATTTSGTTTQPVKPQTTSTTQSTKATPVVAKANDTPLTKQTVTTTNPATPPPPNFDGGIFKADFLDNGKSVNGTAGIFKSTSGWQDGKYYALMNNVSIGSIVKVTDGTGKTVYVKVLGQLPDMKESVGLTIRISNAAAAEIGQTAERFNVQVSY